MGRARISSTTADHWIGGDGGIFVFLALRSALNFFLLSPYLFLQLSKLTHDHVIAVVGAC